MKKPPEDLARKLVAASNQFAGTGLDVSIDEVAQAADVPRATVYYYFSGRDDLIAFFLNHKLESVSTAIGKAAAAEGSVEDRLGGIIRAVLGAMAEQPALCTELPGALRRLGTDFGEVAMKADRVMAAPVRDLLIEGKANGELSIVDVEVALDAIHGALSHVALMQITRTGGLNADHIADRLVPLMMDGLRAG